MKYYILSTAMMLTATMASSQTTWTYADCVAYAREHNISLQKSRLAEETSASDLEEAKAQWQPSLDFSTSHTLSNAPWTEDRKSVV